MSAQVVFYRLSTRFLQQDGKPPEVSKQIVYYSLALGHHVGVIDTFKAALTWPYEDYLAWVETLPEGEARRKLDGVRRFGEIMIDSSHTAAAPTCPEAGRGRRPPRARRARPRPRRTDPRHRAGAGAVPDGEAPPLSKRVILTVGNSLMGDDGAGPLLAELLESEPAPGWAVIDGGSARRT